MNIEIPIEAGAISIAIDDAYLRGLLSPAKEPRWMTVDEASDYMRVSSRTVWRYIGERGIPFSRLGSKTLIDRLEIDKILRGGGVL